MGQELARREGEEALLVGSDLVDTHVRVARVVVLIQLFQKLVGVRPQRQRSLEVVGLAILDELLEVRGQRQLL